MLNRPEPACLVIADISGYTGFLAGSELDHAQDILADLMGSVVGSLRPTFKLAKLEGDAAFAYVITPTVDGPALQDTLERTYFAFQRRLRDVKQSSTCECNACALMPNLDLKLLAHHGEVGRHRIAGWEELVGSDVILVHRLLKNHVVETLGVHAYVMYTDACIRVMGLADPAAAGLIEHVEDYEIIGEIRTWIRDLDLAWRSERERARVLVAPDKSAWTYEYVMPGPPAVVWEWVTSPARRPMWQHGVTAVLQVEGGARRGVGTTNHCVHGKEATVEEVLDWQPVDYATLRFLVPMPGAPKITISQVLEPLADGRTKVVARLLKPPPKAFALVEPMIPFLQAEYEASYTALAPLIAEDVASRSSEPTPEPDIPTSAGRHLGASTSAGAGGVDSGLVHSSST